MQTDTISLLVLGDPEERAALVEKLAPLAEIQEADGPTQALSKLKGRDVDALFYPWQLAGKTWRDMLVQLRQSGLDVPMIVYCRYGGDCEWLDVMNGGGFDLIAPPYDTYHLGSLLNHVKASVRGQKFHLLRGLAVAGSGVQLLGGYM